MPIRSPSASYDYPKGYILTRSEYVEVPGRHVEGDENERHAYNERYTEQFQYYAEDVEEDKEMRNENFASSDGVHEDADDHDNDDDDDFDSNDGGKRIFGKRYMIWKPDSFDYYDPNGRDDNIATGRNIVPFSDLKYHLVRSFTNSWAHRRRKRSIRKYINRVDKMR